MNRTSRRIFVRCFLLLGLSFILSVALLTLESNIDHLKPQEILSIQPCNVQTTWPSQTTREVQLHQEIHQLQQTIKDLKKNLEHQKKLSRYDQMNHAESCSSTYIQKQIEGSELLRGKKWNNEYEIVPFSFFTANRFYPTDLGLGRRVVEKPMGSRRQDLLEAITLAMSVLNGNSTREIQFSSLSNQSAVQKTYTAQDFVEGIYRMDPLEGTQYELWFQNRNHSAKKNPLSSSLTKVILVRPHAPLVVVRREMVTDDEGKNMINIIVPLSGRLTAFQSFLQRFERNILVKDDRIHLTVVFFGYDQWYEVKQEMLLFEQRTHFSRFHLLNINGTFSRAYGLQVGAEHWEGSPKDILLFFCDVDISFSVDFLSRCRRQTKPKHQAYFPIVFSLYNPNITYILNQRDMPDEQQQITIHTNTGFWRNFGFGMACTYRSDFLHLGGFRGYTSTGWGGEDILLYRKYIRSSLRIIRAPDPGLFHLWHPKKCPSSLGMQQQEACLRSRALSEASHDQLGFLLFNSHFSESND